MYDSGEEFLNELYKDLHISDIVMHTADKSDSPTTKINKYLARLDRVVNKAHQKEHDWNLFKSLCHSKYVIKEEDIKDGTILTLTFEVSKDVQTKKPLNVKAEIADGDFYDNNLNYVEATTESGSITALDFTPGDLNGDGKINIKDVVLIRRYIIGDYDTKINENASNVDDDGKVNSADVILLRRYIAGGYGVELKAPSSLPCDHTMEQVDYKSATCTEEGNSKYWKCTTCGKYFSDVYGNHGITLESTVIPATGHTIVIDKAVDPTYTSTGLPEGSQCSGCGTVLKKQEEIPA